MINIPVIFSVLLLVASVVFLQRSRRAGASEKVLGRLSSDFISTDKINFGAVQRELVRTGIHLDFWRVMLLVGIWLVLLVIVLWSAGVLAFIVTAIASIVLLRFYLLVRLRRRLQRMIVQLPQLLDHIIRSLKSGRTLGDGFLLAIDNCQQPLHGALLRTRNSIQRGMPLSDAVDDFAALYDQEEFHILALSMSVNQRYGGNASEVLENLIRLIRDRDQASRQLRAMTGETRMSALVLGGLPIAMAGYLFLSSPDLLLGMWEQTSGQLVLLFAFALQLIGSFLLWRMMRSI